MTAAVVGGAVATFDTPQLGYNNCNLDCCSEHMPSAAFMESTGHTMVQRGYLAAGYNYLTMDDCWMLTTRAELGFGSQIPDPVKFPNGVANVTAFAHAHGFQFGIYTAMAHTTCGGKMGSCSHFSSDAAQYAAWGVDYVKVQLT